MEQIRDMLKSIMEGQRFAVLATQGGGVPYTNLVAFAYSDDLTRLVFITQRGTSKFRNINGNPYVSLFIDNRANRSSDIASAVGISVTGVASELDDTLKDVFLPAYLVRHPYLETFALDSDNVLVSVEVTRYTVVRHFSQVEVIDPRSFNGI